MEHLILKTLQNEGSKLPVPNLRLPFDEEKPHDENIAPLTTKSGVRFCFDGQTMF
jgi:hypothetical protein